MTNAKTSTERMRDLEARRIARGWVWVKIMAPEHHRAPIRAFAKTLAEQEKRK